MTKVNDNTYKVKATKALKSFDSTEGQGNKDWVGFAVETGFDDITKVKYNGTLLTQADADEAATVGVEKGSFVLWTAYSELPKTFTLSTNAEGKTITIKKA